MPSQRTTERAKYYRDNKAKCIAANIRQNKKTIASRQRWVLEYLRAHPCVDCGMADPVVLEFDHVRDKKVAPVARMVRRGYSLARIEAEIEKCEVRCANCHRRRTAKSRGWFRAA